MTEIDHDESNLEQRLRTHYQRHYEPPQAPSSVWARVQPDLNRQPESASRRAQRVQWLAALTGFLVAKLQDAFLQRQEEDHLMENAPKIEPAEIDSLHPMRNRQMPGWHLRHTLEAVMAVLLVASLVLGWFAVTKWRSAQGNGPALYTYAGLPGEYIYDYQWTSDSKHLMFVVYIQATNRYRYMVWDAATGKTRQTLTIDLPADLTGKVILDSSDGHYALIRTTGAARQEWVLKLANILTGQTRLIYQGIYQEPDASGVPSVAFSEDSKSVAFIGADERIHIWNIAAGSTTQITNAVGTIGVSGEQWLMWSLDGKRIVAKSANANLARLQAWNVQTGQQLLNIAETPTMSLFYWPPEFGNLGGLSLDGTRILTYNKQTGVMVERDSSTLKVLHTFAIRVTLPGQEIASATPLWVANGTRLFMQENQALYIWDASMGKLIATISLKDDPQANVGILPSGSGGRYIALSKSGNQAEIWDIVTGTKVRTIESIISSQGGIEWSSDGKYLDLNDYDQNGQIDNALTGQFILNYQGDNASLSPDDRYVVTLSVTDLQKILRILPVPNL